MLIPQQLRRQMLSQRRQLSLTARNVAAQQVAQQISALPTFQRCQHIAFYLAVNGELDPSPLLELAWRQQKTCYLPVLHPLSLNRLWFMPYQPGDKLQPNRYGILEPILDFKNLCPAWRLQMVITPLVAFDEQGYRLGMGKGFYDRTFAFLRYAQQRSFPCLVGLAYEFQKVKQLIAKPWDIPLAITVTEKQLHTRHR